MKFLRPICCLPFGRSVGRRKQRNSSNVAVICHIKFRFILDRNSLLEWQRSCCWFPLQATNYRHQPNFLLLLRVCLCWNVLLIVVVVALLVSSLRFNQTRRQQQQHSSIVRYTQLPLASCCSTAEQCKFVVESLS